jgi:hypothetical protein
MPHLPFSIELHDSDVTSIVLDNGAATVKLRPAYVHRDGKGWSQDADRFLSMISKIAKPEVNAWSDS